jgi:hypothetical protein
MDLAAIRDGLADAIRTLPGVTVYKTPPTSVNPPAVVIHSGEPLVEYHTANARGLATVRLNVSVLVSRADDTRAVQALDGYLSSGTGSDRSLIDAIEADRTLGGAVDSLAVESASGPFANTDGGSNLAASTLELAIYARRT